MRIRNHNTIIDNQMVIKAIQHNDNSWSIEVLTCGNSFVMADNLTSERAKRILDEIYISENYYLKD